VTRPSPRPAPRAAPRLAGAWVASFVLHALVFAAWYGRAEERRPIGAGVATIAVGEIGFAPEPQTSGADDLAAPAPPEAEGEPEPPAPPVPDDMPVIEEEVLELEAPSPLADAALAVGPHLAPAADAPVRARRTEGPISVRTAAPPAAPAAVAPPAPARAASGGGAPGVPVVLSRVEPSYPPVLRAQGVQGRVSLHVLVGTRGEVREVRVETSSGHAAFDEAALRALHAWRFAPPASAYWVRVPVRFRLS
jgi:protein TonB